MCVNSCFQIAAFLDEWRHAVDKRLVRKCRELLDESFPPRRGICTEPYLDTEFMMQQTVAENQLWGHIPEIDPVDELVKKQQVGVSFKSERCCRALVTIVTR